MASRSLLSRRLTRGHPGRYHRLRQARRGAEERLKGERVLVISGDALTDCDLSSLRMSPQKVFLPIYLSRGYEAILEVNGGALEASRTGFGYVGIKAAEVRADVAGLADGHYVLADFLPAPDCFVTLARALERFREDRETPQSEPLSVVQARFGETFGAVERKRLDCPWGTKGRVMRGLAERFGADADEILTDGVKLNLEGGSWVLMLPDHNNPHFYVYAEGSVEANGSAKSATNSADGGSYSGDSDRSEALVSEHAQLVEEIIKRE